MNDQLWFRPDGQPGPELRECLTAAAAAPSIHNTQPWLFRPRADTVDVVADWTRRLDVLDPDGRELYVSVGAAVFNLGVAISAHGRRADILVLPDADRPEVAARIVLGRARRPTSAATALAAAIPRRHTNRRPFRDREVPAAVLADLTVAGDRHRTTVIVADTTLRSAVLALARTAENVQRTDPAYRAELAAWTTPGGVGRRDGVPRDAFGPHDEHKAIPLRDFGLGNGAPIATAHFERDPAVLLLFTGGDTPADWVRAGMALERVLLTATVRGLAATPLSQVVEVPRLRSLLAGGLEGRVLQNVLRVGYPATPMRPTPRRPIEETLRP
ncbi:Nitroreductase family protein [Asanoa hainanensis]|uniref:Nitroreductase family protein n=1 Tax=Asanoa hainanensis TaxID=560556 RepID=A0A239P176_9ACTN|nr:nitroreductase family protein [Asanoa hainanensis]SNT60887.1 Nitroreductase family protein [Asanoa hainanensis]